MNSSKRLSIVIVSWNGLHHLQTFLPSVVESATSETEIIIADNGSTDDSKRWVQEHYSSVNFVELGENFGYCGGNNRALDYVEGEFVLFLNNDVHVSSDWIPPLLKAFDDPTIGIIQPKIRSYKQPAFFEYAGAAGGCLDQLGYPFCRGRIFDFVEKDENQYDNSEPLWWASGAAFAIRTQLFKEMGGFDERFEFHMEEIDLCWRVLRKGFSIKLAPNSIVYHLGGGSLAMGSPRKVYYNFRNSWFMLLNNAPDDWLKSYAYQRVLLDIVAMKKEFLSGNFSIGWAIFSALKEIVFQLPMCMKKRARLKQALGIPILPLPFSAKSVVWDYFIRGKKTYPEVKSNLFSNY